MTSTYSSTAFINQGAVYFLRSKKIICRLCLDLKDPIDHSLMQNALTSSIARADYFRVRLVQEKRELCLLPNEQPCLVYEGRPREIPEQTNDYLFCLSCERNRLYCDWHHFISDGQGMFRFLVQVLTDYCHLRYGTNLPTCTVVSDPPYSVEELIAQHRPDRPQNDPQQTILPTEENEVQRSLLCVEWDSLLSLANQYHVRPFSCLLALFCCVLQQCKQSSVVSYNYPTDTRQVLGVPNALYNCVAAFKDTVDFSTVPDFSALASLLNERVEQSLQPESQLRQEALQQGWVQDVFQMRGSLKIKQRVFQMGELASGMFSDDFWLSVVGDLLREQPALKDYIVGCQLWVPPEGASVGIETARLGDQLILSVQDKLGRADFAQTIRTVFEKQGVHVLSVQTEGLF